MVVAKSAQAIAIVLGTFHKAESEIMLKAAKAAARAKKLAVRYVVRVPGSYEKPLAIKRLLLRPDVDAVVALGIIEHGETAHGRVMGQSVSDAIVNMQLEFMKPVGIGIIGPEIHPTQIPPRLEGHATAAVNAVSVMLKADHSPE
jgi:6,7-dimethyl-8-ribityllumazine synthase